MAILTDSTFNRLTVYSYETIGIELAYESGQNNILENTGY